MPLDTLPSPTHCAACTEPIPTAPSNGACPWAILTSPQDPSPDKPGRIAVCWECAARLARLDMARTKPGESPPVALYLVKSKDPANDPNRLGAPKPTGYEVTDWTGQLRFPVLRISAGRHNMARTQHRFRFMAAGHSFIGTRTGDMDLARVRRSKEA